MEMTVKVREHRLAAGRSQEEVASAIGISRQAYSAIEKGASVPSTLVAIRLAQVLGVAVEELFSVAHEEGSGTLDVVLVGDSNAGNLQGSAVSVCRVGERWIARPLAGHMKGTANIASPDGFIHEAPSAQLAKIDPFEPIRRAPDLVTVGCDPATPVLGAYLDAEDFRFVWVDEGSKKALQDLALGYAHVAGCHIYDESTGDHNLPLVREALAFRAIVVTFSFWEQGLIIARGNPKRIRGIEDLARPGVTIVNREVGSGSRALLDRSLDRAGMDQADVAGYERVTHGHVSVATVVAAGLADAGVAVRAAATAAGVDFIPLTNERYDLVIPLHFVNYEPVQKLLEALKQPGLRRRIEALTGYDTSEMGTERSSA